MKRIIHPLLHSLFTPVIMAFALVACGGGGNGGGGGDTTTNPQSSTSGDEKSSGNEVSQTVVIKAYDQMKYDKESFTVSAGETIELKLKHVGSMPKSAMGHNMVVLELSADPKAFSNAAADAKDNGYIPKDMENSIIAHTKLLGGGEEDTIEFQAPEQTGEYPFVCSFPAHYAAGMKGVMIVE